MSYVIGKFIVKFFSYIGELQKKIVGCSILKTGWLKVQYSRYGGLILKMWWLNIKDMIAQYY
jgi:hypothetical protein